MVFNLCISQNYHNLLNPRLIFFKNYKLHLNLNFRVTKKSTLKYHQMIDHYFYHNI